MGVEIVLLHGLSTMYVRTWAICRGSVQIYRVHALGDPGMWMEE